MGSIIFSRCVERNTFRSGPLVTQDLRSFRVPGENRAGKPSDLHAFAGSAVSSFAATDRQIHTDDDIVDLTVRATPARPKENFSKMDKSYKADQIKAIGQDNVSIGTVNA